MGTVYYERIFLSWGLRSIKRAAAKKASMAGAVVSENRPHPKLAIGVVSQPTNPPPAHARMAGH
jgi:hypothetical protein